MIAETITRLKAITLLTLIFVTASGMAEDSEIFSDRQFLFPGGRTKALILSYDDGPSQDMRFVELLNRYGVKGTFNVNSGRLGLDAEWMAEFIGEPGQYVTAEELRVVYEGHEIASHTVNHPHVLELNSQQLREEIVHDVELLESLAAAPVESFAYPFGEFDDRIVAVLADTSITNARTVEDTNGFALPDDPLRWHPTVHHTRALPLVDEFLALDSDAPALLMIWGHSWEFDKGAADNRWAVAEAIVEKLGGHEDIWYAGAGELVRYLQAVRNLANVDGLWVNHSSSTVWVRDGNGLRQIPPP